MSTLKEVFHEEEITNILVIPISIIDREDRLLRHFAQNDSYIVKYGYHLAHHFKLIKQAEASARPGPNA